VVHNLDSRFFFLLLFIVCWLIDLKKIAGQRRKVYIYWSLQEVREPKAILRSEWKPEIQFCKFKQIDLSASKFYLLISVISNSSSNCILIPYQESLSILFIHSRLLFIFLQITTIHVLSSHSKELFTSCIYFCFCFLAVILFTVFYSVTPLIKSIDTYVGLVFYIFRNLSNLLNKFVF
jgi:hypothetical protein